MLLANLAKSDEIVKALQLEGSEGRASSKTTLDRLLDCFVSTADDKQDAKADYDYLAYFFADISKV